MPLYIEIFKKNKICNLWEKKQLLLGKVLKFSKICLIFFGIFSINPRPAVLFNFVPDPGPLS